MPQFISDPSYTNMRSTHHHHQQQQQQSFGSSRIDPQNLTAPPPLPERAFINGHRDAAFQAGRIYYNDTTNNPYQDRALSLNQQQQQQQQCHHRGLIDQTSSRTMRVFHGGITQHDCRPPTRNQNHQHEASREAERWQKPG
ncbi:uncharacterized protein LOC127253304 [Andrographis paniculata]|uniref:uncharacterized protein LOC127253304 n=1 Tax=Andrographis paniculata TaxID=175694 RepID=UPI0021E960EA|nr:uncharacterized protein LOC127253304 [Andrographis paniculata]